MAQIALNHVEKAYTGGVKAVDDLSLDVRDGEFMVFVGPSGCGKTTALRMVAGLETVANKTGSSRKIERRLRYVVAWICLDAVCELFPLASCGVGPDQHAVSTAFSYCFHHEFVQIR
jgi:energy-coupling factor transporter ATP-binding protein EcfA2